MDSNVGNIRRTPVVYRNMKDPSMLKYFYKFKTIELIKNNEIMGSSPPDLFIGRVGYPNVYVGPLVPPELGDTSVMGTPESWVGKTIPEIVQYRSLLVRGMFKTKITNLNGRIEDMMQEMAIADKYTDVDIKLTRKPHLSISFDENSQPFGPSAPLQNMTLGNIKANPSVEKAFSDTALLASNAIIELYERGVLVSKIQKALSGGVLGVGKNRKFVPTRWSITAVDDTLSKYKRAKVKEYEPIDSVRVYENVALDNRWIIIMVPGSWEYESIEAWYPNTTWNMESKDIAIYSSYEGYKGRKTYAEIGGCYYAARLATTELLDREQRQAKVVILREAHPGYIMPVGVWNVREYVRQTYTKEPTRFSSIREAMDYASKKLDIPMSAWVRNSTLLKNMLMQKLLVN